MFDARYSRLKFWIWSLILLIINIPFAIISKVESNYSQNTDDLIVSIIILSLPSIIWINSLANRIRDYGSNPWIALFALLPIVNIFLALYYGIKQYKTVNNTENNDISITKAVYNHAKDLSNEIKPTINEYKEKHTTSNSTPPPATSNNISDNSNISENNPILNEDEIYENVLLEIEEDNKVKSTWAKALSQSDGDDKKANSLYIKLRVDTLLIEKKTQIENERKNIEEQKKQEELQRLEEERIENERLESIEREERINKQRIKNAANDKFLKKSFIVIIIISIIYFSYEQITDIYSADKQLSNGDKYYLKSDKQDYTKAFKWYEKSALQGNADGQFRLGAMYNIGKGVNQDYKEAFKWYEKSALQGNADGQYMLGVMYYSGKGVNQDYKEAFKWYEKSALQVNADAQYSVGEMYLLGNGVNQDDKEAFKWFEKSALQGNADGQGSLAEMYYRGIGVNQNKNKAKQLLKNLCEIGSGSYYCNKLKEYSF